MSKPFFLALVLGLACSCSAQPPVRTLVEGKYVAILLDSAEAAHSITYDRTDRFLERITKVEMSIQTQKPLDNADRSVWLARYVDFIRRDVNGFTPDEAQYVAETMRPILAECAALAPDILPDTLLLLKTKGKHVGESVYYTRENAIVLSEDVLQRGNRKPELFASTMRHEVFHVYSRMRPNKRAALYKLIGFENIGLDNLNLPPALAERIIHNPDGVDFAQKIALKQADGSIKQAIPVLYANHLGYTPVNKTFFDYVAFDLYEVQQQPGGRWNVLVGADGFSSTLKVQTQPDFFRQIRDNTGYIIHPDEVLADNFSFYLESLKNPKSTEKFSPEGKALLDAMGAVLRQR